jgi:hypothetical protein
MQTQNQQILKFLKIKGNTITPKQAVKLFNCWRLGARIYDLRKAGYKIINNGKTFGNYELIESDLKPKNARNIEMIPLETI